MAEARPSETLSRTSFGILFSVSIVVAIGNTGLQSVLPSMSRELGFKDWMAPAIFSLSAVLWAIMSPIWARQSDLRGRKPLIIVGLTGFLVSMILCGVVISAGLHHLVDYFTVFILFLFVEVVRDGVQMDRMRLRDFQFRFTLWAAQDFALLDFVLIHVNFGATIGAANHGTILRRNIRGAESRRIATATDHRIIYRERGSQSQPVTKELLR